MAGQSWERTLYRKIRACRAVIALCTDSYLSSHWCFAEIALARMEGKTIFGVKADPLTEGANLPSILTESQWVDVRHDPDGQYDRLWRGLEKLDLRGIATDWEPGASPYLGLRAYQEEHAAVFFGREEASRNAAALVDRGAPNLIMVLGSSGSGKSSLVRAGVLPRLRGAVKDLRPPDERPEGWREPGHWLIVDPFRPGRDAFESLSRSLASAFEYYGVGPARDPGLHRRVRDQLDPAATDAAAADGPEALQRPDEPPASGPVDEAAAETAWASDQSPDDTINVVTDLLGRIQELRAKPSVRGQPRLAEFLDWTLEDLQAMPLESGHEVAAVPPRTRTTPLLDLADELRQGAGRPDAQVLIVIDQFEELFPPDQMGEEKLRADRFLRCLRESLDIPDAPITVLGTMRSDFLEAFQSHGVTSGIDFESLSLGPMDQAALRRVIVKPAALAAIELDDDLVEAMLYETASSDALPLLSYTLASLASEESLRDGRLSLAEYRAIGGVQGAISREADSLLRSRTVGRRGRDREAELQAAFVRLARITEDGRFARQVVPWDDRELQPVLDVLEAMIERRLLVKGGEEGRATVEVAHEALFRKSEVIGDWLEARRAEMTLRGQLSRDAREWRRQQSALRGGPDAEGDGVHQAGDLLWRGSRLARARALAVDRGSVEHRFLNASARKRRVAVGTAAAVAVLTMVTVTGLWQRAASQRDRALVQTARVAAIQSYADRAEGIDRSLLVALVSDQIASTFESRSSLLSLLAEGGRIEGVLFRHDALVHSVAADPEGRYVASAGDGGRIHVADLERGTDMIFEHPDGASVRSLSVSGDGTLLASVGGRQLVLWSLASGERVDAVQGQEDSISVVAFDGGSPGVLAVGRSRGDVQLWEAGSGFSRATTLPGAGAPVRALAFSPTGRYLAASDDVGRVHLWERPGVNSTERTGSRIWPREGAPIDQSPAVSVSFDGSGDRLAVAFNDGHVRVFDTRGRELDHEFRAHPGPLRALVFCGAGSSQLFTATESGRILRWGHDQASEVTSHSSSVIGLGAGSTRDMECGANGRRLVSSGNNRRVMWWMLDGVDAPPVLDVAPSDAVEAVAFSTGTPRAVAGHTDGQVVVWDFARGTRLRTVSLPVPVGADPAPALAVAISSDGNQFAGGYSNGAVIVADASSTGGVQTIVRDGQSTEVWSMAFSPDGSLMAIGYGDGVTTLYRSEPVGPTPDRSPRWRELGQIESEGDQARVRALAFNSEGSRLATARGGLVSFARVWAVPDLQSIGDSVAYEWKTGEHAGSILSLAFDLAAGGGSETLFVGHSRNFVLPWSGPTGDAEPGRVGVRGDTLWGHEEGVRGLAFDPETGWLASASGDGTIRIWDPARSVALFELRGHEHDVHSVHFRDAGLMSGSRDGTLRRWPLDGLSPGFEGGLDRARTREVVCRMARRNLSADEWDRFFALPPREVCPDR